jgi:hypothetical protein
MDQYVLASSLIMREQMVHIRENLHVYPHACVPGTDIKSGDQWPAGRPETGTKYSLKTSHSTSYTYYKSHMWMQFANTTQYQHLCLVKCSTSVVKEVAD